MAFPRLEEVLLPILKDMEQKERYNLPKAERFIGRFFNLSNDEKSFEASKWLFGKPLKELATLSREYLCHEGYISSFKRIWVVIF